MQRIRSRQKKYRAGRRSSGGSLEDEADGKDLTVNGKKLLLIERDLNGL